MSDRAPIARRSTWAVAGRLVAMLIALAGCGRTEPSAATQPEIAAQPEAPAKASGPIADPSRETTLAPSDMKPIREITLRLPTGGKGFEVRKAGLPRSVFSAPHLTFVGGGPVAPGRIIVAVKESAEYESRTLETHLVDLDRGSIAKFSRATTWQVPKFGLAKVFVDIDGVGHRALLHASDGLIVRLYVELDHTTTDVVINPGKGDGWVFAHDPREPEAPTRYAHWQDLRKPPPVPDKTLPFSVTDPAHFAASPGDRDRPSMTRIELPSVSDPRAVDPIVFNAAHKGGCNRLELRGDGSFACADYLLALGSGWRLGRIERNPVLYNLETKQVQHLDITAHCLGDQGAGFEVAGSMFEPPRVLFGCGLQGYELLWSPDALEIVRRRKIQGERGQEFWSRDHSSRTIPRVSADGAGFHHDEWLDLGGRVSVVTPDVANDSGYGWSGAYVVTSDDSPGFVYAFSTSTAMVDLVARTNCTSVADEGAVPGFWMLTCQDARERPLWSEVIDLGARVRWRWGRPHGDWNARAWVDRGGARVVTTQRHAGADHVDVWDLPI